MISRKSSISRKTFYLVLLTCLLVTCVGCAPSTTPTPTPFVLPPRTIPPVQGWDKPIKSICLVAKQDYPSSGYTIRIDDVISATISGLGLDVLSPESACEAVMTLNVEGVALAGHYIQGDLYTGAEINGYFSLEKPGEVTLEWTTHGRIDPPDMVVFQEFEKLPTRPGDYDFYNLFIFEFMGFLNKIWGPRVYVSALGINSLYSYSSTQLGTIGLRPDIFTDLMYAMRDPNPTDLRCRAMIVIGHFAPQSNSAIPLIIENLGDPNPEVRGWAATVLGGLGSNANSAVPALKVALKQEKNSQVRDDILRALRDITGKDYK